jgi:hypothetical protein
MEPFFPLHAWVCDQCLLVQLETFEAPERIFSDYAYFSSFSESWLAHARAYAESMVERFALNAQTLVAEVASNDGYLLKNFVGLGIPVLGIEPAENVAVEAERAGVRTVTNFFSEALGAELARDYGHAQLIAANNVLAHVPDINDFVAGFVRLLAAEGVATFEFPHLLRLIEHCQFDTIYHEHFSYLSLLSVNTIFERHGLRIFDVTELSTHGGSLRIFVCHDRAAHRTADSVLRVLRAERDSGLGDPAGYERFEQRVIDVKLALLSFLIDARIAGKQVVAYGAPAKGNTLLNYCGVGPELIGYTVDISPHKQGRLLPGCRIPIHAPARIAETQPDYVVILPWNLRDEITEAMAHIAEWGGRFVVPIPTLEVIE